MHVTHPVSHCFWHVIHEGRREGSANINKQLQLLIPLNHLNGIREVVQIRQVKAHRCIQNKSLTR